MSEAHFGVEYDGRALREGLMDVRDLAPSLLAVGQLLEEVNKQVNDRETTVSVYVQADFERGSFGIDLTAIQGFLTKTKGLLLGQDAKDAQELAKIAGFIGVAGKKAYLGAIALKKWLKGRKPEKETELKDGRIRIKFEAEGAFTTRDVLALLGNDRAIRAIDKITAPLERDGIDVMNIKEPVTGKIVETIDKADRKFLRASTAPAFELRSEQEVTEGGKLISRRKTLLRLTRVSFRRGNKYSVVEGDTEFSVSIEDEDFLALVERDEIKFSAHGKMLVILRQEIIPGETKDTVEHAVEKVLEYIEPQPQPSQIKLLTD